MSGDAPDRPLTPAEALTAQFAAWERRGRGWDVWPYPVELEPPFRPFLGYQPPAGVPGVDDGRSHTLVSALLASLGNLLRRPPPRPELPQELEEHAALPFAGDDALAEVQVASPPDLKVSPESAARLLVGLSHAAYPVSFEVVGDAAAVTVQVCCREEDLPDLRQQLGAVFPGAVLRREAGFLATRWGPPPAGEGAGDDGEPQGPTAAVVDFGLTHEFMLPLSTPRGFAVDPLAAVAGALSDLREGEVGVLQVLFEAARNPWVPSTLRAVSDGEGGSFFADAPDFPKLAREKVSTPLFAAVVRAGAVSPDPHRAWGVVRSLAGALAAFGDPLGNALMPLENDEYPDADHVADLLARQSRRSGMLLNAQELASLAHLPDASVQVPKLVREVKKTKAAPASTRGHALTLGENQHAGEVVPVTLSPEQRVQHTYVVGGTGTGKSTLLANLIVQDMQQGRGVAVLDPHGDLVDQLLGLVPPERVDDVILFDPADADYPVGFNVLQAHSEHEKTLLSSDLVETFRKLSTSWGDQMHTVLQNAVLAFLESARGGTLADLRRFLVEPRYRAAFLETVTDPNVLYYWRETFRLLQKKPEAAILTRLDAFLRPKLVRNVVCQREQTLDLAAAMGRGRIVLAKLAQGLIGEENSYLLGTLLVSRFYQVALTRQELQEAQRRPFFLYVDEFHNFTTATMAQVLAGARKYRLGLTLAHQDLRQLLARDPETADAVLTNPHTRVCFRVGDQDARKLAEGFATFEARDLMALGRGEAVCRVERADYDFNLETAPPLAVDLAQAAAVRERVVARSRERNATPRAQVEAALRESLGAGAPPQPGERRKPPPEEPPPAPPTPEPPPESPPPPAPPPPAAPAPSLEEPPPAPPAPEPSVQPTPPAEAPERPPEPPAGRGGEAHKAIQARVREAAEARGWRATVEHTVPDGGRVDVALTRARVTVACEVCVHQRAARELGNLRKCLRAGFDHVVVVAPERATLRRVRKAALAALGEADGATVHYLLPGELPGLLATLEVAARAAERTYGGRRLRVTVRRGDAPGPDDPRRELADLLARALRRQRDEE